MPEDWLIWSAGNRKEDRAVYDMPSPLANRFIHLEVDPDFESFKAYALSHGIHEQLIAFSPTALPCSTSSIPTSPPGPLRARG